MSADLSGGSARTDATVLRLRDAAFTYPGPPPVDALRPMNLAFGAGEHVAVMGASGSGKSTLLNLLGLLSAPTAGSIEFEGRDVTSLSETEITSLRGERIGFVFQAFHLIPHRTAAENVELALVYRGVPPSERRVAVADVLDGVGLGHRAEALPSQLSGGERQRVAVARAVVGRPALLLCDEPTGSLDSASTERVLELLDGFRDAGLTVVVVTHDPLVAQRARRLVVIHDGAVREDTAVSAGAGAGAGAGVGSAGAGDAAGPVGRFE